MAYSPPQEVLDALAQVKREQEQLTKNVETTEHYIEEALRPTRAKLEDFKTKLRAANLLEHDLMQIIDGPLPQLTPTIRAAAANQRLRGIVYAVIVQRDRDSSDELVSVHANPAEAGQSLPMLEYGHVFFPHYTILRVWV